MNTIILTSKLDLYEKDEEGLRHPRHFGNLNGILDLLKSEATGRENLLYIASTRDDHEMTDMYFEPFKKSFDMTLPFKNYIVLDGRNEESAESLIRKADLIILAGGHVPTQNKFFKKIGLKELLKNVNAPVLGMSAGSMNLEKTVWCPPELEGESLDKNFQKYFSGLGYTDLKILPHYDDYEGLILDGKDYLKDIIMPDSFSREILAINDGSYIVISGGQEVLFGEAYILKDGKETMICSHGQSVKLN